MKEIHYNDGCLDFNPYRIYALLWPETKKEYEPILRKKQEELYDTNLSLGIVDMEHFPIAPMRTELYNTILNSGWDTKPYDLFYRDYPIMKGEYRFQVAHLNNSRGESSEVILDRIIKKKIAQIDSAVYRLFEKNLNVGSINLDRRFVSMIDKIGSPDKSIKTGCSYLYREMCWFDFNEDIKKLKQFIGQQSELLDEYLEVNISSEQSDNLFKAFLEKGGFLLSPKISIVKSINARSRAVFDIQVSSTLGRQFQAKFSGILAQVLYLFLLKNLDRKFKNEDFDFEHYAYGSKKQEDLQQLIALCLTIDKHYEDMRLPDALKKAYNSIISIDKNAFTHLGNAFSDAEPSKEFDLFKVQKSTQPVKRWLELRKEYISYPDNYNEAYEYWLKVIKEQWNRITQ